MKTVIEMSEKGSYRAKMTESKTDLQNGTVQRSISYYKLVWIEKERLIFRNALDVCTWFFRINRKSIDITQYYSIMRKLLETRSEIIVGFLCSEQF